MGCRRRRGRLRPRRGYRLPLGIQNSDASRAWLAQKRIDSQQIGLRQYPAIGPKPQADDHGVVPGQGQFAHRGIELLLRIQYIQVDTYPDFIPGTIGLQGCSARLLAGFQPFDAGESGRDAIEVLLRLLQRLPFGGLQVKSGFPLEFAFFGNPRSDRAT